MRFLVVGVWLILGLASSVYAGTATFRMTNQEFPSLDGIATFVMEGWEADIGQPTPSTTDYAFFVTNTTTSCPLSSVHSAFSPSSVAGQVATFASVPLAPEVGLAQGNTYVLCYYSQQQSQFYVVPYASRESSDQIREFTILEPAFDAFSLTYPSGTARDGMGPVRAEATENFVAGRQLTKRSRNGKLVPCGSTCDNFTSTLVQCASVTTDVITVAPVTSTTSTVLFFVPFDGSTREYHVCMPYDDDVPTGESWAVIRGTRIQFQAASPSDFDSDPAFPRSRQNTFLSLKAVVGESFSTSDSVKVVTHGAVCGVSGNEVTGMSVGTVVPDYLDPAAAVVAVTYTSIVGVGGRIEGTVCYSPAALSGNSTHAAVWAPVYNSTARDPFVILPTNPSRLAPQATSHTPRVAEPVTAEFEGVGLTSADSAYFVESSSCDSSTPDVFCSQTPQFPCAIAPGDNATSVKCSVTYDEDTTGTATLCGCYNTTVSRNPVLVAGGISLAPRNPSQVAVSIDPLYGAQQAELVFTGTELSTNDDISFVALGDSCGPSTLSNVSFAFASTSTNAVDGTVEMRYNILASAGSCVTVCYKHASGSGEWVRSILSRTTGTADCPATALYATPYDVMFTTTPSAPNARQTFQFSHMPVGVSSYEDTVVKLVAVTAGCEATLGGACPIIGPCEATNASDYSSGAKVTKTGSAFSSPGHVRMSGRFMLCAFVGDAFVALRLDGTSVFSPSFSFAVGEANPSAAVVAPAMRRNLGHIQLSVSGQGLNASADVALLFNKPALLGTEDDVCDFIESAGASAIGATALPTASSTTLTVFRLTGTDGIASGVTEVALCYYLGGSRPVFGGSFPLLDSHPALPTRTPSSGLAGLAPIRLQFPTGTQGSPSPALAPSTDNLFFYSTSSNPTCRCTRATCAVDAVRINTTERLAGTSTLSTWANNVSGMPNIASGATYVVCYAAASNDGGINAVTGSDFPPTTYLGFFTATAAHPTFYGVTVNARVGRRVTVDARTRCTTCSALATGDRLAVQRVGGPLASCWEATTDALESGVVQNLSSTAIAGGVASRVFAMDVAGDYRVCYRLRSSERYTELANSSFVVQPFSLLPPDPSAFTVFPTNPTAGQMLTVTLTCSGTSGCTCKTVRLVPGERASCWATVNGTFTSGGCNGDSITFRGADVGAGSFTVCYGSGDDSARVPGTLVVSAANPSVYDHALGSDISTNQAGDVNLTITGTLLSVADDRMAVLPRGSTFHCHDLSTAFDLENNLPWEVASRDGWEPTIPGEQGPKAMGSSGNVIWTLTTDQGSGLFFRDSILNNTFCSTPGLSCEFQLCYRRSGTSWARVPFARTIPLTLVTANPVFVQYDKTGYRAGQYGVVNVIGAGLHSTDVFFVAFGGSCSGELVAQLATSTPVVSADARNYTAAVRFLPTSNLPSTTTACYRRGSVVNFVPATSGLSTVQREYRYLSPVLNASNHVASGDGPAVYYYGQLEHARFFATSSGVVLGSVLSAVLMPTASECPYGGFNTPIPTTARTFTLNASDSSFEVILDVAAGDYVLCVGRTDNRMFRIGSDTMRPSETTLTVLPLTPNRYTTAPSPPLVDQVFTLTAVGPTASRGATLLSSDDDVVVISGTFEDCHNVDPAYSEQLLEPESIPLSGAFATVRKDSSTGSVTLNVTTPVAGLQRTVCYRRHRGTYFALPTLSQYALGGPTPAEGALPPSQAYDRNLDVYAPVILRWSTDVAEPSVGNPFVLSFTANASIVPTFPVAAEDDAMLIPVADGTHIPKAGDCADAAAASASTGSVQVLSTTSTAWSIVAAPDIGFYVVCYRVESQPAAAFRFVADPGLLEIHPPASPYNVTTDVVAPPHEREFYVREAVFLFFHTAEPLDLVLVPGATSTQDAVSFSERDDCSDAASNNVAELIPESFNYADPGTATRQALHVRFTQAGTFYVCVRRFNRTSAQRFFAFDSVGGPSAPTLLEVRPFPIEAVTSTPQVRRAYFPATVAEVRSSVLLADSNAEYWFVENQGLAGASGDNIVADECYYPNSTQLNSSLASPRRDRSLAWERVGANSSTVNLRSNPPVGFNIGGWFTLCYKLDQRRVASYYPPLEVLDTVPVHYAVPAQLAVGATFDMEFYGNDTEGALAIDGNLFVVRNASITTACDGALSDNAPIARGTGVEGTFVERNASRAVARLRILGPGTYLVCFAPFDQYPGPLMKRTRRDTGGFFFTIGDAGPSNYSVSPDPARQGHTITVTIDGKQLSGSDRVKIVDAAAIADEDLVGACTDSAPSMNAATNNAAGDTVAFDSATRVSVMARVNSTTTRAIVCYFADGVGWVYVTSPATFPVYDPQPSAFATAPFTAGAASPRRSVYQNEVFDVALFATIIDPTLPALSSSDAFKLVDASAAPSDGFHCAAATAATSAITAPVDGASPVFSLSGPSAIGGSDAMTTTLCGTQSARIDLVTCYLVDGTAWAEVPNRLPAASAAEFRRLEYRGPVATGAALTPSDPSVNEPFVIDFSGVHTGDRITNVFFTSEAMSPCNATFAQTFAAETPVFVTAEPGGVANRYRVALPRAGRFGIVVQTAEAGPTTNITTTLAVDVGGCIPCTMTPVWAFEGSTPTLQVNSPSIGGLGSNDLLKLVAPTDVAAQAAPCDGAPAWSAWTDGSQANHTPTLAGPFAASFAVPIPLTSAVADVVATYAVCYRRSGRASFTQIANTPEFDVRPYQPSAVTRCPEVIFGGQRVRINFTASDAVDMGSTNDEWLSHSGDEVLVVRGGRACELWESVPVQAVAGATDPAPFALWFADLPAILDAAADFNGAIDLCYRHRNDAAGFRKVASFAVLASDPVGLPSRPTEPTIGMRDIAVWATGTFLDGPGSQAYIVDNATSCREECGTTLNPTTIADTSLSINSTAIWVDFTAPPTTPRTVKLCYRRSSSTVLAEVPGRTTIGPFNPHSVTSNVTLYSESSVFLSFHGAGPFASGDTASLALTSVACNDASAPRLAQGTFLFANDTAATFLFDLRGVAAGTVQACYTRAEQHPTFVADVDLLPLPWLTWTSSNTPMAFRYTTITFPEYDPLANSTIYGVGDEAKITLSAPDTASCHDGATACSTCAALVSDVNTDRNAMRVLLPARDYRVCFRLSDSGWFEVPPIPLTVIAPQPATFDTVPAVDQIFQGQRIFVTFSAPPSVSAGHEALLVTSARGCGPQPAAQPDGVVQRVGVDSSTLQARFHLPSIGPGNDSWSFPLNISVCFLEDGQPELLDAAHVSAGREDIVIRPASPVLVATAPAAPRLGQINVSYSFGTIVQPQTQDTTFAVHVPRASDDFNRSCDAPSRVAVSPTSMSTGTAVFSATVLDDSQTTIVFCYLRFDGTVAEVASIELEPRSPGDFEIVDRPLDRHRVKRRQYARYALNGSSAGPLTATDGADVLITERDCAGGIDDPASHLAARISDLDLAGSGDALLFTAQILRVPAGGDARICVRQFGVWSEIPRDLTTLEATPTWLTVLPPSPTPPRLGRAISLNFTAHVTADMTASGSPFLDTAYATAYPGWCNATTAAAAEAPLQIGGSSGSSATADATFWGSPSSDPTIGASYTVCTREESRLQEPLADAALSDEFAESQLSFLPAHPTGMTLFSVAPRVGQRITATFTAAPGREFTSGDSVKLVAYDPASPADPANACHNATAVGPHTYTGSAIVLGSGATSANVTFVESPEPYESFAAAADYTVCFYDARDAQWAYAGGAVGGVPSSRLPVERRVPDAWTMAGGEPFLRTRFNITVYDSQFASSVIDVGNDQLWLVPQSMTCAAANIGPGDTPCATCVRAQLDSSRSNGTAAVAYGISVPVIGDYRVCYRLADSTAAQAGPLLTVTAGYVECVLPFNEFPPTVGRYSQLAFRLRDDTVDTSADGFLVARAVSGVVQDDDPCSGDFVVPTHTYDMTRRLAHYPTASPPNSTFDLEWPVMADNATHTVCFRHRGVVSPVCTCDQIASGSLDCFVDVAAADPVGFTVAPRPTYVGQDVTVTFASVAAFDAGFIAQVPPTFPAAFRTCWSLTDTDLDANPAWLRARFTAATVTAAERHPAFPADPTSANFFNVSYKHDYTLGAESLLVCVRNAATQSLYARAPVVEDFAAVASLAEHDAIVHRPYVAFSTFPTSTSDLLRANQTVDVTIVHTAAHPAGDDELSLDRDELVVVPTATSCTEVGAVAASVAMIAMGNETGPAFRPRSASADSTTVRIIVADAGTHAICYRLGHGTWAPVTPAIVFGPALFGECAAPHETLPVTAEAVVRARQYLPVETAALVLPNAVSLVAAGRATMRLVRRGFHCEDDSAAVATSPGVETTADAIRGMLRAVAAGDYDVCLRVDAAQSLFSPLCLRPFHRFAVALPTSASTTRTLRRCFSAGITHNLTLTAPAGADARPWMPSSTSGDVVRFIHSADECDALASIATKNTSTSVVVNGRVPAAALNTVQVSPISATSATAASVAPVVVRESTSIRVCFRDSRGTWADVVVIGAPTATANGSSVAFTQQLPDAVATAPGQPTSAQRIVLNVSHPVPPAAALVPYTPYADVTVADPPEHWEQPGVEAAAFAPTVDVYATGAAYLGVGACQQYAFPSPHAVVAATSPASEVTTVAFPEGLEGRPAACYFVVGCGWMDVATIALLAPNPSRATSAPPTPRRGQLVKYAFYPNVNDTDAQALQAGADRAVFTDRRTCFADLTANNAEARAVVRSGVAPNGTAITVIAYAEPPATAAAVTRFRVCYFIDGGAWASVPDGVSDVLAANPTHFDTEPVAPTTHARTTITFRGTGLSNRDRAKVIPLALNCSDDSVPEANMTSLAAGTFDPVAGTSGGWGVVYAAQDPSSTVLNITTTVPGTYSVCYKLEADSVWTLVYGNLVVEPRNPDAYRMVPAGALEGELFTLTFTRRNDTASPWPVSTTNEMAATDAVQLIYGEHPNCYSASLRGILIQTEPSDSRRLTAEQDFQLAAGTRGPHTLCYLRRDAGRETRSIWGFGRVVIGPNPESMATAPATPSRDQLVQLVFSGHGLLDGSAVPGETDEVKLLLPGEDCRTVNESAATSAAVTRIGFTSDGTTSRLRVVSTVAGPFRVCYKLFGGIWHALDNTVSFADPNPVLAAVSKAISTPGAVKDNEQVVAEIDYLAGRSGWHQGDYVAYVARPGTTATTGSACFDAAALAAAPALALSLNATTGRMQRAFRFPRADTYDLCYVSPIGGSGAVTVLARAIGIGQGATVSRLHTHAAFRDSAERVLKYTFDAAGAASPTAPLATSVAALNSASTITVVGNETECVGSPPPSDTRGLVVEGVWADNTHPGPNGTTTVTRTFNATIVLASEARVVLCHVQRDAACTTECARVIAVIDVGAPAAVSFGANVAYTSEVVGTTFTLPSLAAASGSARIAWAAEISSTAEDAQARIAACRTTSYAAAVAMQQGVTITSAPAGVATAVGSFTVPRAARFALCLALAGAADWPFVFTATELLALRSVVTAFDFDDPDGVNVGSVFRGTANGRGLTTQDTVFLRVAPGSTAEAEAAGTATPANCTAPADAAAGDVPGTSLAPAPQSGVASTRWSFAASQAGFYTVCYRIRGQAAANANGSVTVGSVVSRMFIADPYLATGTPFRVSFTGLSLQADDQVAFALAVELCYNGSTATTFEPVATVANSNRLSTSRPATLLQPERYYACYRPRYGRVVGFANPVLDVNARRAAGVRFAQTPQCTAWLVCDTQPVVVLVDASGQVTSDPTLRLEALFIADAVIDGRTVANSSLPEEAATGLTTHAISNSSTLAFFAVRFNLAGRFRLTVRAALSGGQVFAATSDRFTVDPNPALKFVDITCTPADMRWQVASARSLCTVRRVTSDAADELEVIVFAYGTSARLGTATRNGTAGGPEEHWIVTVPTDAFVANAINVTVRPPASNAFTNSPTQQDWTLVRLVTFPGPNTAFACEPTVVLEEQSSVGPLVREGDNVTCSMQPKYPGTATDSAATVNVAAYGTDFELAVVTMAQRFSTRQQSSAAVVVARPTLPRLPADINGATGFTFEAPRSPGWVEARAGYYARDSSTAAGLTASPYAARVIGRPTRATTVTCVATGANQTVALFLPATSTTCVVEAHDATGEILTLRSDLSLTVTSAGGPVSAGGALTDPQGAAVVGHELTYDFTVPSASSTVAGDETFAVSVTRVASGVTIASFAGSLLYIRSASEPEYVPGAVTTVRVSGSGLRFANFSISESRTCSDPVPVESTSDPGTTDVALTFVAPPHAFFVCYRLVEDDAYQLLSSRAFNNGTRVSDVEEERIDNLVLLLVGLGLLAVLVVLALCLLCGVLLAADKPLFYPAAVHPGHVGDAPRTAQAASGAVPADVERVPDDDDALVTAADGESGSAAASPTSSGDGDAEPPLLHSARGSDDEGDGAAPAQAAPAEATTRPRRSSRTAAAKEVPERVGSWVADQAAQETGKPSGSAGATQPASAPAPVAQETAAAPVAHTAFVPVPPSHTTSAPQRRALPAYSDPATAAFVSRGLPPPQPGRPGRRPLTLSAHSSGPHLAGANQHGSVDAA